MLPCKLLLHFFVLCLELCLHFKPFLDLRQLFLKFESLSIALGLPLVVHEKTQALGVKLVCLIADDLFQHICDCCLLLFFL